MSNRAELNITSDSDAILTIHLNGAAVEHSIAGVPCPMSRANRIVETFGAFVQTWEQDGGWKCGVSKGTYRTVLASAPICMD